MSNQVLLWVGFAAFVGTMLALDLGVFHRKAHVVKLKEALAWAAVWISLALLFNLGVYLFRGPGPALDFLTAYLIEESLSVDNLFVFLIIFRYFGVPPLYQHRILFWGILGAVIMRAIFIIAGVTLIQRFHWLIYIFGGFLVLTGVRMALRSEKEIHPERNPVLRLSRRLIPVTNHYADGRFFVKEKRYLATPMFIVLLMVETTDVIFAVDSIPAVLAISLDPFIVYSSNVFAILGLRALYFALAHTMQLFHFLHYGLSAILIFVGAKMLISEIYRIPVGIALGVIAGTLLICVIASLVRRPKTEAVATLDPVSAGDTESHRPTEAHDPR